MKRVLIALCLLGLGACRAGRGTGAASGMMFILDCKGVGKNEGTPSMPQLFNLSPNFFAAEPIQDIDTNPLGQNIGARVNRLIIRLQTTGREREVNDVLTFDIPDSREVARCVRARVNADGSPDWDTTNCFQGPDYPRLRVAPDALVQGYLSPNATCTTQLVGTAIANIRMPNDGNWQSWIELAAFGTAGQPTLAPAQRTTVGEDFKIELDDHLEAPAFSLDLMDDAVVRGQRSPQDAFIGGTFVGNFDFNLERGQGAQTFP